MSVSKFMGYLKRVKRYDVAMIRIDMEDTIKKYVQEQYSEWKGKDGAVLSSSGEWTLFFGGIFTAKKFFKIGVAFGTSCSE